MYNHKILKKNQLYARGGVFYVGDLFYNRRDEPLARAGIHRAGDEGEAR